MVDGPDIRISNASGVRPSQPAGPAGQAGRAESGVRGAEGRESTSVRQVTDSMQLHNGVSLPDMPISILSDAVLTRSEWGWRRFLADFVENSLLANAANRADFPSGDESTSEAPNSNQESKVSQAAIAMLMSQEGQEKQSVAGFSAVVSAMRQLMDQAARLPVQRVWQSEWPKQSDNPQLVSFSQVDVSALPQEIQRDVQQWILLDRMSAAVQDGGAPQFGGGVCVVPANADKAARGVRWRAHRSSHLDSGGRTAHRLVLELNLREQPARVTVVTMNPHVAVYIETDNGRLRLKISEGKTFLTDSLKRTGWTLQNLAVSSYQEMGGTVNEP